MTVMDAKAKTKKDFPAVEMEMCIRDFLAQEGAVQAVLQGKPLSGTTGAKGSIGPQPTIDSLVVVEVLVELEPMVPFTLPDSLVRAGGYDSIDQVVQHLVPQLQKRWDKHHEEK
jgi:hypothetical protein